MVSREDVFANLFALLRAATLPEGYRWATTSRRLKEWTQVPPADQPALFLQETFQEVAENNLALPEERWHAHVWVYFRADGSPDPNCPPDTLVNIFIDSVLKAIRNPRAGERQTLGGLVYHCKVDGTIAFDSGVLDNQGVIVIPLTILIGGNF